MLLMGADLFPEAISKSATCPSLPILANKRLLESNDNLAKPLKLVFKLFDLNESALDECE